LETVSAQKAHIFGALGGSGSHGVLFRLNGPSRIDCAYSRAQQSRRSHFRRWHHSCLFIPVGFFKWSANGRF
jgi:hypothetical protein